MSGWFDFESDVALSQRCCLHLVVLFMSLDGDACARSHINVPPLPLHSPTPSSASLLALQWAVEHGIAYEGSETTALNKRLALAREKKSKAELRKA